MHFFWQFYRVHTNTLFDLLQQISVDTLLQTYFYYWIEYSRFLGTDAIICNFVGEWKSWLKYILYEPYKTAKKSAFFTYILHSLHYVNKWTYY
jgi:hypothetical protein